MPPGLSFRTDNRVHASFNECLPHKVLLDKKRNVQR